MEEFKINHQLVYFDHRNALGVSMNLLTFGLTQFANSYCVQNKSILKRLSENYEPGKTPDINLISHFALNNLIDAIKITICFENFFKSLLLLNGYIAHKIDKDSIPEFAKTQKNEPVYFDDLRAIYPWEINNSVKTEIESLKNQIKGITSNTLGMSILTRPGYYSVFNIPQDTINLCKHYFNYRNNLHYYMGESFFLNENSYNNLDKIIEFINKNIVRIQNEVVTKLGRPGSRIFGPI